MQVTRYVETGGREGLGRIMIFLPPRHGKTQTVSRLFPAWFLGRNPTRRVMATSYGASLAHRNSKFVRNLIDHPEYADFYPGVNLEQGSRAVDLWDLERYGGGMTAAGIGGAITGHGANIGIIDDPIKSRAEAESPTYRQNLKDWYNNDFYTRIEEPGGAIIVMLTRWHMDDLAGYLLADDTESWEVLKLPAIAQEEDPLGRAVGEALWPERYDLPVLQKRRDRGEYAFAALYQQTPIPSGGGLFDATQIKVVDQAPECVQVVRFYDLAVTVKKHSDYTVGLKLGVTKDEQYIILDIWRVQKTAPEIQAGIVQNARIDGAGVRVRLEAEKAGIIQLDYLLRDTRMRPYTLDAKPPAGDKYTRATAPAARVNAGRVSMIRAGWNRALLDELAVFPMGEHDDQVDALSGAYDMLTMPDRVAFEIG